MITDEKLIIEVRNSRGLKKFVQEKETEFKKQGYKLLGIPSETVLRNINNFEPILESVKTAIAGNINNDIEIPKFDYPVYVSRDMIKDEQLVTTLHVNIQLVENDRLKLEDFKESPDQRNAQFILNEAGQYQCGYLVEKMSKRYHNVVNPDHVIQQYGCDTLRMYEMFLGPIEQSKPWNVDGIEGVSKFLRRFWTLFAEGVSDDKPTADELKSLHTAIKKVNQDIERFSYNTCVSAFMICSSELKKLNCNKRAILEPLCILLSPFAPHLAEELWHQIGNKDSVTLQEFPSHDEAHLTEDSITYPIAINGKKRAEGVFAADASKEDLEKAALEIPVVQKWLEGKTVRKIIVVPKRMINIVIG